MHDAKVKLVWEFDDPQGGEAMSAGDLDAYRGRVPDLMIEFWQRYGTGLILDGYFQFCHPGIYAPILKLIFDGDPDISAEETHVLGFGAFGSMIAWNEVHKGMEIELVRGAVACPAMTGGEKYEDDVVLRSKLMLLDSPTFDEYDADVEKLFEPARSTLGKLGIGQVYGFRPILALGGNRALANLAIYEALPHMAILAQAHEMQLMDNAVFPPQPVRVIRS